MPVARITMTEFMNFTFAPPTRKRTAVRTIKRHEGFPNYYDSAKKAIVNTLYGNDTAGYNHDLSQLTACHQHGRDSSHKENLRSVASAFAEYISENRVRDLDTKIAPGKVNYDIGNLRVSVWGDLHARINNRKLFLKLHFNASEPPEGYDQAAAGLFLLAFPQLVKQGIHPRIMYVRKPCRIFRAPGNLKAIESTLEHEADSFLRYWKEV